MGTATQHADSSAEKINLAKRQIAGILRERRGKQAAISSKGLAAACGLKATTVRDIIPEIRREYELPIASCPGGYYVIEDVRDFERHLEKIDEEIQTRLKHKQELTAAWNVDRRARHE